MRSRFAGQLMMLAITAAWVGCGDVAAAQVRSEAAPAGPVQRAPRAVADDASRRFEVAFFVREDEGVDRRGEPVAIGLPIPLEALADDPDRFRLVDSRGKLHPAQFSVLARWDGRAVDRRMPIRWLLVEFVADIRASRQERYTAVLTDESAPAERRVRVADETEGVWIDTGPAQFRISKARFDLFESVLVDRNRDGKVEAPALRGMGGVRIVRGKGGAYHSHGGPRPRVSVLREGPLVVEVKVQGRFASETHNRAFDGQLSYLEYEARYRFFAGTTRATVGLTIRNPERSRALDIHRGGAESFHQFEDLTVRLGLPECERYEVHAGRDLGLRGKLSKPAPPPRLLLDGDQRLTLYQDSSGAESWQPPKKRATSQWATTFRGFRYLAGGEGRSGGGAPDEPDGGLRAPGWVRVSGEGVDVWLGLERFWENYPKALRVSARGVLEIGLFPGEWRVPHQFRGGVAKTHEIRLDAFPGFRGTEDEELEAWTRAPLSVFPEAEAVRDSFAAGFVSTEDRGTFSSYEREAEAVVRYGGSMPDKQGDIFRERDDKDLYGWMNFGDSFRGGGKESRYFGNNELDFSWCMLLQYLRRDEHEPEFFRVAQSMVWHLLDIDMYHTRRDLFWANHGIRKHDASGITDHGNAPYTSHFWIGGAALYYMVTGDSRVGDRLREIGKWLEALESDPQGRPGVMAYSGEVRSRGWIIHALLDLYEVFGEPSYLRFAQRVASGMVSGALQERGFIINSSKRVFAWQMGYITDAVGRYLWIRHRRGETDEALEKTLVRMLDYLRKETWIEQSGAIAYDVDPLARKIVAANPNLSRVQANGFAYGYCVTGNRTYLEMARKTFHSQDIPKKYPYYYSTTLGTPAKSAGFRLRFGQAYMALAQHLAGDAAPVVKVGGMRRLAKRGPCIFLSADQPMRCEFEVRTIAGQGPTSAPGRPDAFGKDAAGKDAAGKDAAGALPATGIAAAGAADTGAADTGAGDAGAGDAGAAETVAGPRSWKAKLRFPGPRIEPMAERPANPRSFLLRVTPESRKREGRVVELIIDKPGKPEDRDGGGSGSGPGKAKRNDDRKGRGPGREGAGRDG